MGMLTSKDGAGQETGHQSNSQGSRWKAVKVKHGGEGGRRPQSGSYKYVCTEHSVLRWGRYTLQYVDVMEHHVIKRPHT